MVLHRTEEARGVHETISWIHEPLGRPDRHFVLETHTVILDLYLAGLHPPRDLGMRELVQRFVQIQPGEDGIPALDQLTKRRIIINAHE